MEIAKIGDVIEWSFPEDDIHLNLAGKTYQAPVSMVDEEKKQYGVNPDLTKYPEYRIFTQDLIPFDQCKIIERKETFIDWSALLDKILSGKTIEVKLIKPVRNGEEYLNGRVCGFKPGLFGGGHSNYKKNDHGKSVPHSYESNKRHYLKRPKVLVVYNVFTYGGREHSDWVDIDNCLFNLV